MQRMMRQVQGGGGGGGGVGGWYRSGTDDGVVDARCRRGPQDVYRFLDESTCMRRRALLSALPATGSLALAGCLDRARSTVGLQPEVRTLDLGDERPYYLETLFGELDAARVARGQPVEIVAVGSGDDTHWVAVAAESADPVETNVTLAPADGESLYETTVGLSDDRYLGIKLQFVQDYVVAVESERHDGTVDISAERVDCNASTHAVLLAADGRVRSGYMTTDMGCRPP